MTRHRLFKVSMFLILMGCASFVPINGQNLEKHTWKNRILVFKTTDSALQIYQQQVKEFENSEAELKDRKFVLYRITGADFERIDYTKDALTDSGSISGTSLEKIFNAQEHFEVVLIGLDGGVKLRQTEVLSKEDLYGIVDAMPMRRSELNRKNK
ncbi:DUF4174 domain-containing protein [Lutimonas zeaxanthinifaciens]|uniref:DUF4174 domain-containing protein n=1 Tax=Lutimonas zeaxanthinifaciens TaxID=3060215 RepID=UPI00265D1B69|nr:DUF4174 domain-containing protein [Lutimonas sp. YSD2104]WKK67521.1 DUF4174 domain-containing protein [Lutimonas sp. YSD2104]